MKPLATLAKKNFPLTGRTLEQDQTQCRRPFAVTAWVGGRRDWEDRENVKDPGRAVERVLGPAAVQGIRKVGVGDPAPCSRSANHLRVSFFKSVFQKPLPESSC